MKSPGKGKLPQDEQEYNGGSNIAISHHKENHFSYVVKLSVKSVCKVNFILLCYVMLCSENESKYQLPCTAPLVHNSNHFLYVVQSKGGTNVW